MIRKVKGFKSKNRAEGIVRVWEDVLSQLLSGIKINLLHQTVLIHALCHFSAKITKKVSIYKTDIL